MIGDIQNGQHKSPLVIIEDSCDAPGFHVWMSFLRSLVQRVDKVFLIVFEQSPKYYLKHHTSDKICIVDCCTDPLGWNGAGEVLINSDFLEVIEDNVHSTTGNIGIVIDSLVFHILYHPPAVTCQKLHALKNARVKGCDITQTVCLIHVDLHDDSSLIPLRHMATSLITLTHSITPNMQCSVLHKQESGKVIRVCEMFTIDESFFVNNVTEVKNKSALSSIPSEEPIESQADPASNLSFNLTLSDKEQEDRSLVKLPYLKDNTTGITGGGQIFYEVDDIDDFDEEDPDDDLEI